MCWRAVGRFCDEVIVVSNPAIDIIIVNYRSAQDTISAIAMLTPWRHGRILVVDNSEDEGEFDRLQQAVQESASVELLLPEHNLGFGRGCNLAFAQSTAPFVLLLNPDARIDEKNVLLLADVLQQNPRCAALSPRIWWDSTRRLLLPCAFPPTPRMMVGMALASRWRALTQRLALRYLRRQQRIMANGSLNNMSFLVGAVMLLRRSAAEAAGGLFDDAYFMFYEDSDLSLRLREAGYQLGLMTGAEAVHEYRHKPYKAMLMAEAAGVYFAKHYPRFFRLSGGLARLQRLSRPLRWDQWGLAIPSALHSAEQLREQLSDAAGAAMGVVALSPAPELMPALFCPRDSAPQPLDDDDWLRLEPGRYMLLCAPVKGIGPMLRVSFEKA